MGNSNAISRRTIAGAVLTGVLVISGCTAPGNDEPPAPPAPPVNGATTPVSPEPEQPPEEPAAVLNQHGVNAGHPLAAEAGIEMLDAGGTAADAAVAAAFAVSVAEPYASGMGGGGSALVAGPDSEPEAIDYREVVAADGIIPPSNTGIPGFVAGMAELHAQHGVLEWSQLLEPAAQMAEQGVPATENLIRRINAGGADAVAGQAQFAPGGAPLQVGQPLIQTELGATLRTLQDEGPEAFYTGAIAQQLTQVNGIDPVSLERYSVQHNEPVQGEVGDYQVVSSAPALPGAPLIQMLQVLESQGIAEVDPGSAEYVQLVSEAWLLAEQSARTYLGDTDFIDVPVAELTDPLRNAELAGAATAPPAQVGGNLDSPGNTTHLTVVDQDGTVVSMTNTLTEFWGSGTEVGGFYLNDQLNRFNTFNTPQNQPEPGRRSVTWSNPTMVMDGEGRPVLGIGTPGGANILNILANAFIRWGLMGQPLEEAVAAPRFRFDDATQRLVAEQEFLATPAAQELAAQGWQVSASAAGLFGSLQALEIDYDERTVAGPVDTRLEAATVIGEVE